MMFSLFVSCPKGLEYLLEEEVKDIGLRVTRVNPQGVYGEGDLATAYRLCIWSRLANRVQLILLKDEATNQEDIYKLCRHFPWETVFSTDKTLTIEFHGASPDIRNTMFGAQIVKDGIVDQCRELYGTRPVIERDTPQIRLHAYLKNNELTVSFDLSGYSLHQRGYRIQAGAAPLKENVAAAMLIRAKWPQMAEQGFALHDAFCGSGTVVIEAAMMAAHMAPGLLREDQSLHHWAQHDASLWASLRAEALAKVKPLTAKLRGSDIDPQMITMAQANAERAGVLRAIDFDSCAVIDCKAHALKGLFISNPPYGERLSDETPLIPLYQEIGTVLHDHYQHWQAAILTANPLLARAIGLRSGKQYTLYNGAILCKLYCLAVDETNALKNVAKEELSAGAQMLVNRLQKNHAHLQKWAKRNQISCYRVYDADLPEYAYAIDLYNDHVVLQEYAAPSIIAPHKVEQRSLDVHRVVPGVLGIPPENVVMKQRKQQKGTNQYQKMSEMHQTMIVSEGRAKLIVNLHDYLDTGLFLDHRPLRLKFANLPPNTHFLNCFCYTASASVHAALSGAKTTNVDLSKTYLQWAEDNFKLNHLDRAKHQFVQSDCLEWLKTTRERFDVIFLDPPSFSNSKRMNDTLDIQRDHESLISSAMRLLYPGGTLYFSSNLRQFKLSPSIIQNYKVRDINPETIDADFKRNPRIHQCFTIENH